MGTHYNHFNEGNPDTLGGGKVISFEINTSRVGLDVATLSVVTMPGVAAPGSMSLGQSLPAVPGASEAKSRMWCTSLGWRPDQGGARVWTAQYQGIATGSGASSGDASSARRASKRMVTREENFTGSVAVPGFTGQDSLPVRFNNRIWSQREVWISTQEMTWAAIAAKDPPSPSPPPGAPDGPWSGTFEAVRVYPNGWVLRSFSEEQVADGVNLFTGEAEWLYEWKYQPGGV